MAEHFNTIRTAIGNKIHDHLLWCYKELLKEGDKEQIVYFKALVYGCFKKWFHGDGTNKEGYVPYESWLMGYDHKTFLDYVHTSYHAYKNKKGEELRLHTIYGYPTTKMKESIL